MFGIWTVSLNKPVVVSHHIYILFALISRFHHFYILVESFTLFVTYFIQVIREPVQVTEQKINLNAHFVAKFFGMLLAYLGPCLFSLQTISCPDIVDDSDKHAAYTSFQKSHWLSELLVNFHFPNLGLVKYASLQFFLTKTLRRFTKVLKRIIFFVKGFKKLFHKSKFDVLWWEDYFLAIY